MIGAICGAPLLLNSVNSLVKRSFTGLPSVEKKYKNGQYIKERVVIDNNLITSRSPGTAMKFDFAIVKELFLKDSLEIVNKGVMLEI
jgi:putative intracellular protease/amidase|tara:strand:+ start:365 stop:625 length:261 start_codon:yes stop_codon:yes gene_type:complete